MQKRLTSICVCSVIALVIVLLIIGICTINKECQANSQLHTSPQETKQSIIDKTFLWESILTCSTFTIGYSVMLVQIGSKDKFGHSITQDNHFEIFYLRRKSKKLSGATCTRIVPIWVLIPYVSYIAFLLFSSICVLFDHIVCLYLIYAIFVAALFITCLYTLIILHILFSQDWLFHEVKRICKRCNTISKADTAAKALRVLATSDLSSPVDIANIHEQKMVDIIDFLKSDEKHRFKIESAIDYFACLITSYCIAGISTNDEDNIIVLLDKIFCCKNKGRLYAQDYSYFAIAGVFSYKAILEILKENDKDSSIPQYKRIKLRKNAQRLYNWLRGKYDSTNPSDSKSWINVLYSEYVERINLGYLGDLSAANSAYRKLFSIAELYNKHYGIHSITLS